MNKIKGIIFDYGGTLDTNGVHWFHIFRQVYNEHLPQVTEDQLRDAYIYAERYLAQHHVIEPTDDFLMMLRKKVELQTSRLGMEHEVSNGKHTDHTNLPDINPTLYSTYNSLLAETCDAFVRSNMEATRKVLDSVSSQYPLVLVSNFYGNIHSVLRSYNIDKYFHKVIESAAVSIRKPDPQIFALGVDALGLSPQEILVIGDSYRKDIVPAHSLGCRTVWIKGQGWDATDESNDISCADNVIKNLSEILQLV